MSKPTQSPPSALDELLRRVPNLDPHIAAEAKKAVDLLRSLGLLSTEPAEVIQPFRRRAAEPEKPLSFIAPPSV